MKRISTMLCIVTASWLLLLHPVHAVDGTRVTSGALTFESGGQIDIAGQSGFALRAAVGRTGGVFTPKNQCEALDCPPGTTIDLYARWVGNDLPGDASLRGQDYRLGIDDNSAQGDLHFEGTAVAPPFTEDGTVQVSAPFTLSGQLAYPVDSSAAFQVEPLSGEGVATLTLTRSSDGSSWQFTRATYTFRKTKE